MMQSAADRAGPAPASGPGFADRLDRAIRTAGSPVCVGLDPVLGSIPGDVRARRPDAAGAIEEFCSGVLRSVSGVAPAVKFQSACFERYGSAGVAVLERSIGLARSLGLVVVLDAKRGDIGISAEHYAAAARGLGADAITVNGYLGPSTLEPYLEGGLGLFVLVRTSNPDSDAVQAHRLADGRSVAEMMADAVATAGHERLGACGLSDVGAVVGATKSSEGRALRARMPEQVFLVPGYGAQGGTAEDVRALLRSDGRGVLVTASRSVIYAKGDGSWTDAIAAAARKLADEIRTVVG
ncbi:MAG: orotidine-5'-phosphate decarboxylase [Phycisphaerales bacterium]|nr:orotidine-5'-phosphate decarboxylase [Phycisphaerales bacterium]